MNVEYVNHFSELSPPLSPNEKEVDIYKKLIDASENVLLLGYTKQLLHFASEAIDLNPPLFAEEKIKKGDWFEICNFHEVIIGDGVLNLVGGKLVDHLKKFCSKLIIRFFTHKIEGMKYATWFENNTKMLPPDEEYETQNFCKIFVWNFSRKLKVSPMGTFLDQLESEDYKSSFLEKREKVLKDLLTKPLTTRTDLQKIKIPDGSFVSKTSGSTGVPVIVPKTLESSIWLKLTNERELRWRKWDISSGICVTMIARNKEDEIVGNIHSLKMRSISEFQKYLQNVKPTYLYTYPSIISMLDLSLVPSLKDIKSVGEPGGTNYSCEEAGTIAIQCPDYPERGYHIMENIIVESHPEHGAVITDLSNPYITRYIIGDIVELSSEGNCPCGRLLPMIKKIQGRKRNMLVLPGDDRIWPTVGEPLFRSHISEKIKRHRVVQKTLFELEIQIECDKGIILNEEEKRRLSRLVLEQLDQPHLICSVVYKTFEIGKFEAFLSLV